MTIREKVIEELLAEREYQDHKWGGEEHDNSLTQEDWLRHIIKHLCRAAGEVKDLDKFHYHLVRVAALAVAAAEWCVRGEGSKNK